ncbi:MAG: ABC transporter permease [Spirochaetia bacterium]
MKFLISLAWKNLSRYGRRTVITAIAIAVGLGLYIFVDSMLLGADVETERNLIWYETSSAKVMDQEYYDEIGFMPLSENIQNPEEVMEIIEAQGYEAVPRIQFSGELYVQEDPYPETGSLQARITAIDPTQDDDVYRLQDTVVEGNYLTPGEPEVMIGAALAEDLGAQIGYPFTIVTRTQEGAYQTMDLTVVGIVDAPDPVIDRSGVFIPLEYADYQLYLGGAVTEISILVPAYQNLENVIADLRSRISQEFTGLTIVPWQELAQDFTAMSEAKSSGSSMILSLVFIIALVGISNTMLMAVFERIQEIGMMRAMGMKDSEIRLTFLFEAAGIGFIGSVVGVIFGILLNTWLIIWGIDFTALIGDMDIGYRIAGVFYGAWNPGTIITAFFAGIILSAIVAFYPAHKALKMDITECLHYQ